MLLLSLPVSKAAPNQELSELAVRGMRAYERLSTEDVPRGSSHVLKPDCNSSAWLRT